MAVRANRRDRRACSPRTRRRSRVSPTRGAIATRRRERISPRASLARASPPRPASRRPRATPRDRRREAPRGSSPRNASSLVARSTAWRAVSANAASRRARSRARAVSVASAPTRITAKERARVGVKSSPLASSPSPSASAFASFESFAFSFAFARVMVSGKAATHAAATRWASAEESGRAKKRREARGVVEGGGIRRVGREAARPRVTRGVARGAEVEGRAPRRLRGDEIRSGGEVGGFARAEWRGGNAAGRRGGGEGCRISRDLGAGAAGSGRGGAPGRGWRIWSPRGGATDARDRGAPGRGAARGRRYRETRRQGRRAGCSCTGRRRSRGAAWRDSRAPRLTATRERLASWTRAKSSRRRCTRASTSSARPRRALWSTRSARTEEARG